MPKRSVGSAFLLLLHLELGIDFADLSEGAGGDQGFRSGERFGHGGLDRIGLGRGAADYRLAPEAGDDADIGHASGQSGQAVENLCSACFCGYCEDDVAPSSADRFYHHEDG